MAKNRSKKLIFVGKVKSFLTSFPDKSSTSPEKYQKKMNIEIKKFVSIILV